MTDTNKNPPLLGYSDVLSARPGDTVSFKVSSASAAPFTARLVRSISADPNPAGQGIVEEDASAFFKTRTIPSVDRPFFAGSYGIADTEIALPSDAAVKISAIVFPTLRSDTRQTVLSVGALDFHVDPAGAVALRVGGQSVSVSYTHLTLPTNREV